MNKYGELKTTRIMMATVSLVTSGSGLSSRWFFWTVYILHREHRAITLNYG